MDDLIEISPGVFLHIDFGQAVYTGTAEALIAADLVKQQQLPGQPGNGRGMCIFNLDGSSVAKGTSAEPGPGRKYIVAKKCSMGSVFEVRMKLSHERLEAIKAQRARETACWPFPLVVGSPPRGNPFASDQRGITA